MGLLLVEGKDDMGYYRKRFKNCDGKADIIDFHAEHRH